MVGAGQGGAGSAIFAQEPPSLPISPSSSPGAHLPERPPPPPLQSPAGQRAGSKECRHAGEVEELRRGDACFGSSWWWCLLLREGQEEKLEASGHLHHFLLLPVSPFQLLTVSSLSPLFLGFTKTDKFVILFIIPPGKVKDWQYSEHHLRFYQS